MAMAELMHATGMAEPLDLDELCHFTVEAGGHQVRVAADPCNRLAALFRHPSLASDKPCNLSAHSKARWLVVSHELVGLSQYVLGQLLHARNLLDS